MNTKYLLSLGRSGYFLMTLLLMLTSCQKDQGLAEDPYAGGKDSFGIGFVEALPSPASGPAGSEVEFKVKGAKAWEGKFNFLVGDELTTVVSFTDTTIRFVYQPI